MAKWISNTNVNNSNIIHKPVNTSLWVSNIVIDEGDV